MIAFPRSSQGYIDISFDAIAWPWQFPFEKKEIRRILLAMREAAGLSEVNLAVKFCDDAEIARINLASLGRYGPTNIITFPCADSCEGSMILSLDCLWREALLYGQPPVRHLVWLLAHGFGHLGNLDHGPRLDAIQTICLEAAGFSR